MKNRLPRREFIQKMIVGTLTTPFLLNLLKSNLYAQNDRPTQSVIWIQGQGGGHHRPGIRSYPGFNSFLSKHFILITADDPDINSKAIEFSDQGKSHILILNGFFSQNLDDPLNNLLKDLIVASKAVILLGNESSYSSNKPDGFLNLETDLLHLVETPFIKLPGNPVHIRHLVGTLNHMILYDLPDLDEYRRPTMFYAEKICNRCQFRGDFERGNFVNYYGQKEGCLYLLGCKGPFTKNSCAIEKWNGTTSWCVSSGSPCTGCSEPNYPDNNGLGLFGQLSADTTPINSFFVRNASTIAQGAFAVTLAGVGIHAFSGRKSSKMTDDPFIGYEEDKDA